MCCLGPVGILAGAGPGRPCAGLACCWAPAGGHDPVTGRFLTPGMQALADASLHSKAVKEAWELFLAAKVQGLGLRVEGQRLPAHVMLVLGPLISPAKCRAQWCEPRHATATGMPLWQEKCKVPIAARPWAVMMQDLGPLSQPGTVSSGADLSPADLRMQPIQPAVYQARAGLALHKVV